MKPTDQILKTWEENSKSWIEVIQGGIIPSRKITNPAIIEISKKHLTGSILDLGCGEGWLSRELSNSGFNLVGLDATAALIESARSYKTKNCTFETVSFEDIISWSANETQSDLLDEIKKKPMDGIIFNFCLYEEKDLQELLIAVGKLIKKSGKILIQTIHPSAMISMGLLYKSQWLDDAWKGLSGNFQNGHPWYFRTLESWTKEFNAVELKINKIFEPTAKEAAQPSSIIFVLNF